jgi:hypothetical protein
MNSVAVAHLIIPALYLLFGIFGALSFANISYDDRSEIEYNYYAQLSDIRGSKTAYDVARYDCIIHTYIVLLLPYIYVRYFRGIVAISLLCTFPVDCLVTVSTWRRFWRRYKIYRCDISIHMYITSIDIYGLVLSI